MVENRIARGGRWEYITIVYPAESSGTTDEAPVMGVEEQPQVMYRSFLIGSPIHGVEYDNRSCRLTSQEVTNIHGENKHKT